MRVSPWELGSFSRAHGVDRAHEALAGARLYDERAEGNGMRSVQGARGEGVNLAHALFVE